MGHFSLSKLLVSILILLSLGPAALAAPAALPAQPEAPAISPAAPTAALPAPAVLSPEEIGKILDGVNASLTSIEKRLQKPELTDAELQELGAELSPASEQLLTAIPRLTPRLAAIQSRIDQLGPKPAAGAPPESPAVTAERADQQKAYDQISDLLKRANLLAVQTDQIGKAIANRRHTLFTTSLFERATSLVNPALWVVVVQEIPKDISTVKDLFGDWAGDVNRILTGWRNIAFWSSLGTIVLLYIPAVILLRRGLSRQPSDTNPSRLRKILSAWGIALVAVALPVGTIYALIFIFNIFGLTNDRISPIFHAIGGAMLRVATAAGIAFGLFAPARPAFRLPLLSNKSSRRIFQAIIAIAVIVSITRFFEALTDAIGTSLFILVAIRSLGALIGAIALAAAYWSLGDAAVEQQDARATQGEREQSQEWYGAYRILGWVIVFLILISVLTGYAAFGSFLLDQMLFVHFLAALLFMSLTLIDESMKSLTAPSSKLGHRVTSGLGVRPNSLEFLTIFVSGLLKSGLILIAIFLALVPWGFQSTDVQSEVRAAFFGFRVGVLEISPASVIGAFALFLFTYLGLKGVQQWLDKTLLPHTSLDLGLRNSIKVSFGYIAFMLAASMAMAYLGLSFEKLAWFAGALSVGVGFGLQSIVNNFVSGLIILWERAVRVGDWIVVGSDQGFVRRINIRSTEIETFDRASVIIPNSSLITGVVKNLLRNDSTGRIVISIAANAASDPEKIREVLIEIAKAHDLVLSIPSPQVIFKSVSGTQLEFDLMCYVGDVLSAQRVKSDLNFDIYKRFMEEKFFDGPAADPTSVKLVGIDQLKGLFQPQFSPRPSAAE